MDRKELEAHFNQSIMMQLNANKLLYALLMDDKATLDEMRAMCLRQKTIDASYLDAYDAATDEHERNAVVGCVRHSEPIRIAEVAQKADDFRSGKVKMGL